MCGAQTPQPAPVTEQTEQQQAVRARGARDACHLKRSTIGGAFPFGLPGPSCVSGAACKTCFASAYFFTASTLRLGFRLQSMSTLASAVELVVDDVSLLQPLNCFVKLTIAESRLKTSSSFAAPLCRAEDAAAPVVEELLWVTLET